MTRRLALVAASGLAREVAEAVKAAGDADIVGIYDDDPLSWGSSVSGVQVLGPVERAATVADCEVVLCAGAGAVRRRLQERLCHAGMHDDRYATVVHPMAVVPASCVLGRGSIVLAGVVLTADVVVGRHVVLMPNVVVTHDDVVDDYVTLCAGVLLAGDVHVGTGAYLGAGASVREHVRIGKHSVVGMGAVALQDIPAAEVWVGNPARRRVPTMPRASGSPTPPPVDAC